MDQKHAGPTDALADHATIRVENHGSICLLRATSREQKAQLENITPSDAQWFGGALVVEPRYVQNLLDAIARGEGL